MRLASAFLAMGLACAARAEPGVATSTVAVSTGSAPAPLSRIDAQPNPCVFKEGKSFCQTTLAWKAETSSTTAQVALSANGGPDRALACGLAGTLGIGWIVPGSSYVFSLYAAAGCDPSVRGERLASVTVTGREAKAAAPAPKPKPRPKTAPKAKRGSPG